MLLPNLFGLVNTFNAFSASLNSSVASLGSSIVSSVGTGIKVIGKCAEAYDAAQTVVKVGSSIGHSVFGSNDDDDNNDK